MQRTKPSAASAACLSNRLEGVRASLENLNVSFLLVTSLANIHYLTGFWGSAGVAAVGQSEARLWVDPRYTLEARSDARGVEVIEGKGSLLKAAARWLKRKGPRRVGYEESSLTARDFQVLDETSGRGVRLVPGSGIIEKLRLVKDSDEIARIREAARVTAEAFEEVIPHIRPGVKENDLAAEIEYRMRQRGAEQAAFETIVASGPRGAWPHARPSAKLLQKSELAIFDLGAILGGYCADMTRTLYLGRPGRRVKSLYNAVLEAQREAVESLRTGIRACEVDAAARRVLGRHKLVKFFTHSTGHGVGLEIHEKPRLGKSDKTRMEGGFVVTAEPGIYLEGFGGIRIEDTILVTQGGPEILTNASKQNWFVE